MTTDADYIAARHVRRTTRNPERAYCASDNQDWPCDAARLLAELEGWRLHAQLDHDALGRVWRLRVTDLVPEVYRACRQADPTAYTTAATTAVLAAVRGAIGGERCELPRPRCIYCGAELVAQGPRPDWAAVGAPAYPVLYCPGYPDTGEDRLPCHLPAPAVMGVPEALALLADPPGPVRVVVAVADEAEAAAVAGLAGPAIAGAVFLLPGGRSIRGDQAHGMAVGLEACTHGADCPLHPTIGGVHNFDSDPRGDWAARVQP